MSQEVHWNVATIPPMLNGYLEVCAAAAGSPLFHTFKSHPNYTPILEHASRDIGQNYWEDIQRDNPHLLTDYPKIWDNDSVGSPYMHDVHGRVCSPTTVQYVGVLSNLIKYFGSLDRFNIVEIGGGYGGQAKVITDVYSINRYDILDLEEVTLLQRAYLDWMGVKNTTANVAESHDTSMSYDLVISNYALTEVTEPQQTWYVENVLLKSKHGYITCNGDINALNLIEAKFKVTRLPDVRGERGSNYIVIW